MKVLMIAPQPWFSPRGTPLSVLHRLHTLSKLGHHVDLVTYPIGEDIPIKNVRIFRTSPVPFFKRIAVGPSKRKIIFDVYLYRKALELLKNNQYDILHTHEEAGFFGPRLAKKFNLIHLYDMHSSLPQQLTNFKFTKLRRLITIFEKLERHTITNSEAVITICPELHNYVSGLFPDKFNMLLENLGHDEDIFPSDNIPVDQLREKYHLQNKIVVLYAGTFEHYQGIDLLIQSSVPVLKKHKNVIFFLVGGNPMQVQKYQTMTKELQVAENFVFTGSVKPGQVPSYVSLADILATPRIEGNNTPLKIYSYLRSGKPVVATRHITHTQVLSDDVSILTEMTPDAFGTGLSKLVESAALRQKIADAAQKLAAEKYSYNIYLEKTRKVYEFLAERVKNAKK